MSIRSPICTIAGHVDHGKTTILDKIRGTAIVADEAGKITQSIGASNIPISAIRNVCGDLIDDLGIDMEIPGLLFIDTPGHAAFSNLRKRGGSLADVAILVVDINEGFKPQTKESLEILKENNTPFIVAANKVDLLPGWSSEDNELFLESLSNQSDNVKKEVNDRLYELIGELHEEGFSSERFDRVDDFTKEIAIVPTSAETGLGMPELLMALTGLTQNYMKGDLEIDSSGFARGTILEVKKERGLGVTVDAILYDGSLSVDDKLIIGGLNNPVETNVRALLEPVPESEIRSSKSEFENLDKVSAASGVKISAPGLDDVVAGMPLVSTDDENKEQAIEEVQSEVEELGLVNSEEGVIAKADSLGSLEALGSLLEENDIPVSSFSIGDITKSDISKAESAAEKDSFHGVVLGFNVSPLPESEELARENDINIITSDIIYQIIDDYKNWKQKEKEKIEKGMLKKMITGGKVRVLPGYVFRESNPAVVGVEVLEGEVKSDQPIMNENGERVGVIKEVQDEGETVSKAEAGEEVALSLEGVTVGRQVSVKDILYIDVPEKHFMKMKDLKSHLNSDQISLLKDIADIKREDDFTWGM